jgi:chemotaxis protein MotB
MTYRLTTGLILVPSVGAMLLAGCVSQSAYDKLEAQNHGLQQQVATQQEEIDSAKAQVGRLQGAIKYTVNSDLLFTPGGWEMSARGKQVISRMAAKLAPTQQNKILVTGYTDNAPIGPDLAREGVTSNQALSEKRAQNVKEYLISQGLSPSLVASQGMGESNPIASNDTAKGRSQNRRVELSLAASPS